MSENKIARRYASQAVLDSEERIRLHTEVITLQNKIAKLWEDVVPAEQTEQERYAFLKQVDDLTEQVARLVDDIQVLSFGAIQ